MIMTVERLIAELQKFPSQGIVKTEGCDCYGNVRRVTVEKLTDRFGDYGPENAEVTLVYLRRDEEDLIG